LKKKLRNFSFRTHWCAKPWFRKKKRYRVEFINSKETIVLVLLCMVFKTIKFVLSKHFMIL